MSRIDKYINSIYKNIKGNKKELNIAKQEMKSHLLQSIKELQSEGKSEKESIDIAINRFGEAEQIKKELIKIYGLQKRFSKKILFFSLLLLFISFIFLISKTIIYNYTKDADMNLLSNVKTTIKENSGISQQKISSLFEQNKQKFKYDNKKLKYIAVFQYPKTYTKEKLSKEYPNLKNAKCTYPNIKKLNKDLTRVGYISNASSSEICSTPSNMWYIKASYITPISRYSINNTLTILMIVCFVSYWLLFGIWANINTYHMKGYNLKWSILFFLFNIFAYIMFTLYNKNKIEKLGTTNI